MNKDSIYIRVEIVSTILLLRQSLEGQKYHVHMLIKIPPKYIFGVEGILLIPWVKMRKR